MLKQGMTDKEVGELWLWSVGKEPDGEVHTFTVEEMQGVIRKLVDERAQHLMNRHVVMSAEGKTYFQAALSMALRDFGIPEDEYYK